MIPKNHFKESIGIVKTSASGRDVSDAPRRTYLNDCDMKGNANEEK